MTDAGADQYQTSSRPPNQLMPPTISPYRCCHFLTLIQRRVTTLVSPAAAPASAPRASTARRPTLTAGGELALFGCLRIQARSRRSSWSLPRPCSVRYRSTCWPCWRLWDPKLPSSRGSHQYMWSAGVARQLVMRWNICTASAITGRHLKSSQRFGWAGKKCIICQ